MTDFILIAILFALGGISWDLSKIAKAINKLKDQ